MRLFPKQVGSTAKTSLPSSKFLTASFWFPLKLNLQAAQSIDQTRFISLKTVCILRMHMPYLKLSVNDDLSNHFNHVVNANSTYCLIDQSAVTVAPAAAALDVCHSEAITVHLFFAHHSPQLSYPDTRPLGGLSFSLQVALAI